MKKGMEVVGLISEVDFPNRGICRLPMEPIGEIRFVVKGGLKGQLVRFRIVKLFPKKKRGEGLLLSVEQRAPEETEEGCSCSEICGGCAYQAYPYEKQLEIKEQMIRSLMEEVITEPYEFQPIKGSPVSRFYRNKMEYTFGDEFKGGPLALGMHKRGSFYDIVTTDHCLLVPPDMNLFMRTVLQCARETGLPHYHKVQHTGYFRFLVVRHAKKTGEILVNLVTADAPEGFPEAAFLRKLTATLCALSLEGTLVGLLHTRDNNLADAVEKEQVTTLYGRDFFYEELLNLSFKITPFSFFQTNSLGAEVLYEKAREFIGDTKDQLVFDLYSGTGTIAQMVAPVAKKVIGVEIVPEAVEAAKQNAERNHLSNCEFIAGDVLDVLDTITERPDFIILDPPRDGIHPRAIGKIIAYGVQRLVYISCKPTSLQHDLVIFQEHGYRVERLCPVDMFPGTNQVECVVLLSKLNTKQHIDIELNTDELDLTASESKATYDEIKAYVKEHASLSVSSLYIAQVKQKCGITERENYNKAKSDDSKQPKCPKDKEMAIMDALKYFKMI